MAKRSSSRRAHVSPGIYYKETEVQYATKSLGITTLGLAGETVKGPAFQPIPIENWREFQAYFGGTNTEKFRGSQYPKYELPYIAQEYLKQSKQLEVVRTLGFSGVNAGPAWVITATKHNCGNGYQYDQAFKEDGTPVEVENTLNGIGKSDQGFYGNANFTFNVPGAVLSDGTDNPIQKQKPEIAAMDAHVNGNAGIVYFDDNYAEMFTTLPMGLQMEFASVNEGESNDPATALRDYAIAHNWGNAPEGDEDENHKAGAFYYVDLDNNITDGRIAVVYTLNDEDGIVANYTFDRVSPADHNSGDYETYTEYIKEYVENIDGEDTGRVFRYILIPKSALENMATSETTFATMFPDYDSTYDFAISHFKANQFNYTQINEEDGQPIVSETGKTFKYEANAEPQPTCVEDTAADYDNVVIAVLRSRGEHKKATPSGIDNCGNTVYTYDSIEYYAKTLSLDPPTSMILGDECSPSYNTITGDFNIDALNYGKFIISVDSIQGCDSCGIATTVKHQYSVSLNPADKNYITRVLGTDPEVGDADVYVEELYDIALEQLIYAGEINAINHELAYYPAVYIVPSHEPVDGLATISDEDIDSKRYLNKRYLYTLNESQQELGIHVRVSRDNGASWSEPQLGIPGHIYTVIGWNNPETSKKEYFYGEYRNENGGILEGNKKFTEFLTTYNFERDVVRNNYILANCVRVASEDMYYILTDIDNSDNANDVDVEPITLDFNNYKEEYRYSSTPWIVSEIKGSGSNINLHKLFRFHTISDGDNSVNEVKISIENIDPDNETFDVVVRSFYDTDYNPNVLERFGKCGLTPGESNYLGLRIGTIDEVYASQSAYITVEINEDDITSMSIPCGFLGYPVRNYGGFGIFETSDGSINGTIKQPYIKFNTTIDDEIRAKKQYFGMSDILGIDEDVLTYKGVEAYNDNPDGLTPCFHLDARILNGKPTGSENGVWYTEDTQGNKQVVDVDGVTGYNWVTVAKTEITSEGIEPRIGTEDVMAGTIYEDKNYRKFTLCFYGGWDGWDYYRTSRSNSDEYRYNKYKGSINKVSGQGTMFSMMKNPEAYGFNSADKIITSDYYAYLAAIKQLDNPKTVSINLFATPGIDYVNQTELVNEVIDMVEEERGDALYVITTPDKPFGAGDSKAEMYTPEDVVFNLEDTGIDTNYACTYYPWEKYYDADNNQYIYLPVTRDVLRNMAYTDNIKYPWYASAGWNRGDISGVEPKRKLKLAEQDTLYSGRINYINSFAKEGDRIWGDKNLQVHEGIMNRISKRRLLIRLKNLLSTACVGLLFDPNDAAMAETFKSCVKSVLDPIMSNRGITDYRIEVDDSDEARDRLELPAKIFIKPTQMLEYLDLELIITPQGVQWE